MMQPTLEQLAEKHGTDKLQHGYLPYYEEWYGRLRDMPIRLLEIGIWKGESLRMWRDYFPNSLIAGIDNRRRWQFEDHRIKTFEGDQLDADFMAKVATEVGPLDIVIDDGCHTGLSHVASWRALWPFVKPGGWYVVEDLHTLFICNYTKPGDLTIMDIVGGRRASILRGKDSIREYRVIGRRHRDGLLAIIKR